MVPPHRASPPGRTIATSTSQDQKTYCWLPPADTGIAAVLASPAPPVGADARAYRTMTVPEAHCLSPAARDILDELSEILRADGAELRVHTVASSVSLTFELDLSNSSCPECVMPRELLVDIYRSRLAEVDPDIVSVVIIDPREPGSET